MNEVEQIIKEEVKEDHDYVVSLRRYFHSHPELSKQEFNTALRIEEELHKLGLETQRVGETGVIARIKGDLPGDKVVVLRGDIDALPVTEEHECEYKSTNEGVMHACGHDAHAAGLIGAARVLVKNKDKFGGTVVLTFQQAEEVGYGARVFVNGGYLDDATRCFGIHMHSGSKVGTVTAMAGPNNASVDWFKITVHGLGAHVSTPHLGIDAAYICSQIVVGAQALITRRTSPMDNVLIGIGKINAGTAYNVVAQQGEIEGTIRTLLPATREKVKGELEKLAKDISAIYGGSADVQWQDFGSVLINDEQSTLEVQNVAKRVLGEDKVITKKTPTLGGDDFAEFIIKVPGCYAFVGSGNPDRPETTVAHHNSHFDIDEDALFVSTLLYATYAIDYLNGNVD